MDPDLTSGARTRVRRLPDKQVRERSALDAVLDAGRVAHVAVLDGRGQPYVLPVAYARHDDAADDLGLPVWAGVLPLREAAGRPWPAPGLREDVPLPAYVGLWCQG